MRRRFWILLILVLFLAGCGAGQKLSSPVAAQSGKETDWTKDLAGTWICENRLPRDRIIFIEDTLRYVKDGKIHYEGPYQLDGETTQILLPEEVVVWSFPSLTYQNGKLIAFTPNGENTTPTWIYGKEN